MPIYHIIGNVTSNAAGKVTNVESINDVSSAILYKGIYHICARPTPAHRLSIRPSEPWSILNHATSVRQL